MIVNVVSASIGSLLNPTLTARDVYKRQFVTSGLRLGTPAVTTRGLKEDDMKVIAKAIRLTLLDKKLDEAHELVLGLTEKYPLYE